MYDLNLSDLRVIAVIARLGGFRSAAAELGLSPSTLSHQVAALERRLGVRLFNRTTRSVALTEAGEHFLKRVQPALRQIEEAVETVNRFRDRPAGTLRLNASEEGALRILPIILDFAARYPEMSIDVATEGRLVDIVAGGFDAGLRLAEAVPQDMISIPIGRDEEFVVVGTPAYLEGKPTPRAPADLLAHECIRTRLPSGSIYRWEFERFGEEIRIDVPGRLTLGSFDLALNAARAGAGIAYASLAAVEHELNSGTLVRILTEWTQPFPGLALFYPRQKLPSAGLKAFADHFRNWRKRPAIR